VDRPVAPGCCCSDFQDLWIIAFSRALFRLPRRLPLPSGSARCNCSVPLRAPLPARSHRKFTWRSASRARESVSRAGDTNERRVEEEVSHERLRAGADRRLRLLSTSSASPVLHSNTGACIFIGNAFLQWFTPLDMIFRPTSVASGNHGRGQPYQTSNIDRCARHTRALWWCFTYGAHDRGMRVTREGSPFALALRLPSHELCRNYLLYFARARSLLCEPFSHPEIFDMVDRQRSRTAG